MSKDTFFKNIAEVIDWILHDYNAL